MVTVGSDAHKLEAIGRNFDRAKQLLNSVGWIILPFLKIRDPNNFLGPHTQWNFASQSPKKEWLVQALVSGTL